MSKHSYQPEIRSKIGESRIYQRHVDQMTCKFPGCKRWRVDGTTKFCPDHKGFHLGKVRVYFPVPGEFVNNGGKCV